MVVVVRIAEEQITLRRRRRRDPYRAFREGETAREALELGIGADHAVDGRVDAHDLRGHELAGPGAAGVVEVDRRRADPDEVRRRRGERAVDAEDRELDPLAGLHIPTDDDAVGRVPPADHPAARLAERFRESPIDPDLGAVQDAFISAFRFIKDVEGQSKLGTWLHRIVVTTSLMKLRADKRHVSIEPLLPAYD